MGVAVASILGKSRVNEKMKPSFRIQDISIPLALVLCAAALRFYGVWWGLPQVYEEATPFTEAWHMWGWGPDKNLDLNPHFFHYPSLIFYIQFIGQGLLYLGMKLFGLVDSTMDYRVHYIFGKTPFYVMGRSITALFGVATVWVMYLIGRRIMGKAVVILVTLLLAINTVHVSKSQVIEVDVPMMFFALLTLLFCLRLMDDPIKKNYFMAGLAVGLAASSKYTAAILILPLLFAHLLVWRGVHKSRHPHYGQKNLKPSWTSLLIALLITCVAFFATSPFVLLDASTFFEHFSVERRHMEVGHFGLESIPTWIFYTQAITGRILGWPIALMALFGLIFLTFIKRRTWAIVLAAFLVPYLAIVLSWSMKADRYILPILPVALLFVGGVLTEGSRFRLFEQAPRLWRLGIIILLILIMSAPLIAAYPEHLGRLEPDTRTEAKRWIEDHIPSGAFIVVEHHGPELFGPEQFQALASDLRERISRRITSASFYAVQKLPMLQMRPERSGVFYNPALYRDADIIVTSDAIRGRYMREPERFHSQTSFYDSLETHFEKIQQFLPNGRTGPAILIYKNPHHRIHFSKRKTVYGPIAIEPAGPNVTRTEDSFYNILGLNYETFGYTREAMACYELAFRFPILRQSTYESLVLGRTRCLMALGRSREAADFLKEAEEFALDPRARQHFRRLRASILPEGQNAE